MSQSLTEGIGPAAEDDDASLAAVWLRSGADEPFRRLYRRHTPYLYRVAIGLLGGRVDEAQDAVQEAWVRASSRLASFRWRSSLRTWLSGIVVNCCREARKSRSYGRRSLRVAGTESDRAGPGEEASLESIDVLYAVGTLPDGAREVLILHSIFGHSHAEVASILGISAGTSKSQLSYARARLRERLGHGPSEGSHE
ncbi:MAG TPA: sigma-70 family RNA polymerase sigma factor [Candidatus Polarisedimenticolaceae bacterium]|nr:sigma-70 family RNA polymerase sigma factor [Candidatus Polarisedimenticolaceae bacterium]